MDSFSIKLIVGLAVSLFTTVIGVIYWVIKSRDKLVYKDVCESERRRLGDCIEHAEEMCSQRYKELTKQMDTGFKEVKELIRNQKR